jgi:hypothetical protein
MKNTNLIYGLRDPRNDVYRYIGKTTVGERRPLSHLIESHNVLVNEWVAELQRVNLQPFVDVIEKDIPLEELAAREKHYITHYTRIHEQLFNGGKHLVDTISKPSILSIDDINMLELALSDIGEIYKFYKIQTSFTDQMMADTLNVSRKTVHCIKTSNFKTCIETVHKMVFFIKKGVESVFTYYQANCTTETLPNCDDFLKECAKNSKFCRKWFTEFYKNYISNK